AVDVCRAWENGTVEPLPPQPASPSVAAPFRELTPTERIARARYLLAVRADLDRRGQASLHHAVFLDLGVETAAGSTRLPWDHFDLTDAERKYDRVEDAFAHHQQRLLILGEPGAGKTTSLLRLAEQMLAAAENDPTA